MERSFAGDNFATRATPVRGPGSSFQLQTNSPVKRLKLLLLLLCPLLLSGCGAVASALVDVAIDNAFDTDSNREKNDVRYHLRHGDSVGEAQRAAAEDQMFRELMSM